MTYLLFRGFMYMAVVQAPDTACCWFIVPPFLWSMGQKVLMDRHKILQVFLMVYNPETGNNT